MCGGCCCEGKVVRGGGVCGNPLLPVSPHCGALCCVMCRVASTIGPCNRNGVCDPGENAGTCPADCPAKCGDGFCDRL